jgi:predicted HNH restriction endonuclease
MSAFKSSVVDGEGNINTDKLSKELKDALDADVKFRQTDNMKKKAVKVSTDYNEFKAMVACAHLKKLTSKEVESLSAVKKGWQKVVAKDNSSSALILGKELESEQLASKNNVVHSSSKALEGKLKPISAMEIERDLRRFSTSDDKLL